MKNLIAIHAGTLIAQGDEWFNLKPLVYQMPDHTYIHQNWKPDEGIVNWYIVQRGHAREIHLNDVPKPVRTVLLLMS